MVVDVFGDDGVVWGMQRGYSSLSILLAGVSSLAVWTVLTTHDPFPPSIIPKTGAGFFVLSAIVFPVAVLYGLNRGLVPTYVISLATTVTTDYYTHYVYSGAFVDFGIESSVEEIVLTPILHWFTGILLSVVAIRLRIVLGGEEARSRRNST